MDATNLKFNDEIFDLVIDKGTLDCLFTAKNSFEKIIAMLTVLII